MTNSNTLSYEQASLISCQRVGQFMQLWALLEISLDQVVGAALGLNNLQTVIVTVNIPFAAKIHITKTAVNSGGLPPKRAKHYDRHLNKLWNLNTDRIMVAHYFFGPTVDKAATKFIVAHAKGRLNFPDIIWSEDDFEQRFRKISILDQKLEALAKELKEATISRTAFIRGLTEGLAPNSSTGALGLFGFPTPPQANSQHSNNSTSSPQTMPQKPPKSQD